MGVAYSVGEVDYLNTFFVQWEPSVNGEDTKGRGFVVVENDEINRIDNLFNDPVPMGWEIITVNEEKQSKTVCCVVSKEFEDLLPELSHHSELLDKDRLHMLANRLPPRTQGFPWRLVYSTAVHGMSLKTLYRNLAQLDCPVLLVIKDMDNQVFGAFSSHPFRMSDRCYGTGETFLYSFSPSFRVFHWSGENSYFVRGDVNSLQMGVGGGRFGLWLDCDLFHGSSFPCSTFHNQPLSAKQDFIVQDLEVWTFR